MAFLLARFLKAAAKELAELELEAVLMAVLVTMAETTAGAGTAGVVALAENEMFCYEDSFSSFSSFMVLILSCHCAAVPFLQVVAQRRPRWSGVEACSSVLSVKEAMVARG